MNKTATALLSVGILAASVMLVPAHAMAATPETPKTFKFGMEAAAIADQTKAGVKPDYGTFWVGPWTLKHGWAGPGGQMDSMEAQGVTPAIHFYYWGDDISQSCIENGCWSSLHSSHKNKADWQKLAQQLVDQLNARMEGKPVVIFLETEFNKADVQTYEPLDGYLAEKAAFIKKNYPNAEVVLSLGTWNTPAWKTWDRAAAASDMIGIQAMRGSTKDSYSHYRSLFESTVAGAQTATDLFHKPVFVIDVALSSYPEPEYLKHQADELREFFTGMPALKAAGAEAMIYRSWRDHQMDLANYYGQAERHWGLSWSGSPVKPAGQVWIDGVKAERASAAPVPAPLPVSVPAAGASVEAESFALKQNGVALSETGASGGKAWNLWANGDLRQGLDMAPVEYELKVRARGTTLGGVGPHMDVYLGGQKVLAADPGTAYADHTVKVQGGGAKELRIAFTNDASSATEDRNLVLDKVSLVPVAPKPFTASFQPSPNVNEWWVEVHVTSSSAPAKVAARVDGGAWTELPKTAWGSHAKSVHAPAGSQVTFQAADGHGQTATSEPFTWLQAALPEVPEVPVNLPPVAVPALAVDGLTVHADAAGSSDPEGAALSYAWDFGDGTKASGSRVSHAYQSAGDHTVTLTVSDGSLSHAASKTVTLVQPNRAPVAVLTATTDDLTVTVDGSNSMDPDGDKLVYAWDFGDGGKASGPTASHAYKQDGTYTVRLAVGDGRLSSVKAHTVAVQAPVVPFQPTFAPSAGVNAWWVEVNVSNADPARVDAVIDGATVGLTKTPWGTWAKSVHAPAGAQVQFRATSADGQSAASESYNWLGGPLKATFEPKAQGNPWWVETVVTANKELAKVEVRVNGGAWKTMETTAWGSHALKTDAKLPKGAQVQFRATDVNGLTASSITYSW